MAVEVKNIVVKDVITVKKERSVASAKSLMTYFNLDALIVTDDDEPVGIVTLADIQDRVVDEELDPPDFDGRTPTLEDIELNPILKDSIITLEEQQELMEMIEKLLEELAYYRKLYYLQLLKK